MEPIFTNGLSITRTVDGIVLSQTFRNLQEYRKTHSLVLAFHRLKEGEPQYTAWSYLLRVILKFGILNLGNAHIRISEMKSTVQKMTGLNNLAFEMIKAPKGNSDQNG